MRNIGNKERGINAQLIIQAVHEPLRNLEGIHKRYSTTLKRHRRRGKSNPAKMRLTVPNFVINPKIGIPKS